jgi:hypothetical protein
VDISTTHGLSSWKKPIVAMRTYGNGWIRQKSWCLSVLECSNLPKPCHLYLINSCQLPPTFSIVTSQTSLTAIPDLVSSAASHPLVPHCSHIYCKMQNPPCHFCLKVFHGCPLFSECLKLIYKAHRALYILGLTKSKLSLSAPCTSCSQLCKMWIVSIP